MQQPASVQMGEAGEDSVVAFFSCVGWGPLKTHKHDLGTDLFVQLRADDLTDLRMLIGAQVKTGQSYFSEPGKVHGRSGWWFREADRRHAEYWTNHHVPHILILQTDDMLTRVWVSLDSETIEDTGVGIKVFVPEDQRLDACWKSRWIELATEARKLLSFEGARWTFSITQVPEESWARYALLVPALVAPHPNRGYSSSINWAEAAATCTEGRPEQWPRFSQQHADVPSIEDAYSCDDPGWRFAAAHYKRVMGDAEAMESINESGFSDSLLAALAVCRAISAVDRYDLDQASDLLRREYDAREPSVDRMWLGIHLAHVRRLLGEVGSAERILEDCLGDSAALASDVTISALRSACILGLFELAPFPTGDVAGAVTAADNSASWWRTHFVAHGLELHVKKSFRRWAGDRSIVVGGVGATHNDLVAAAMTARFAGAFQAWRDYISLAAQVDLMIPPDPTIEIHASLDSLRQVGDTRVLKLALQKLLCDGPLDVLAALVELVSPEHATAFSIHADLELLTEIGKYFNADQARPWIDLLLTALHMPGDFQRRYATVQPAHSEILRALAGLGRYLTVSDQESMVRFARSVAESTDQRLETSLERLFRTFDFDAIDRAALTFEVQETRMTWVDRLFRDVLAPHSPPAREAVHAVLVGGDLDALRGVTEATRLRADEATVLLDRCDQVLEGYGHPTNGVELGGQDFYRLATVLALNGPIETRERAWNSVVSAIAANVDVPERMFDALKMIAGHCAAVPIGYRRRLADAALRLRETPPSRYVDVPSGLRPVWAPATELLLEIDASGTEQSALLASLLVGDTDSRRAACDFMGRHPGFEVPLLALTRDSEQSVATCATRSLAMRVTVDPEVSEVFAMQVVGILGRGGERFPLAVLAGVAGGGRITDRGRILLTELARHPSPAVRDGASQLIVEQGWAVSRPATH